MNTASSGAETRARSRLGTRLWLAAAFGVLAGTLCVVLSLVVGERARDFARMETSRYLARLAAEYQERIGPVPEPVRARLARSALEASADPALGVELMLIAADGTVLVGPPALEGVRLSARAAGPEQRWPDGRDYLAAAGTTGADGEARWSTLARVRADAAFAFADRLQAAVLWAALILTLVGVAVGWVFATRHARPLERLTLAAQQIAGGNDRVELPPLDDNREVKRLAQALRAMVARLRAQSESLREAQDRLQRRVHERTAELVRVQAELELQVAEAKLAQEQLARQLAERSS
jgi:methyl-accepting chemotaxis protein